MKLKSTILTCAMLVAVAGTAQPEAQAQAQAAPAATHTVRKGDTLFGIARETQHGGVSQYQMILGIWRANKDAFPEGNVNRLEIGTVLSIPSRESIAAVDAPMAAKLVHELLDARMTQPGTPEMAAARPAAPGTEPANKDAARRFSIGRGLERKGDHAGALAAYLESGEAGYGPAQARLGQIYDSGSPATPRDYETALMWYERARRQGIDLPKPLPRMSPVR